YKYFSYPIVNNTLGLAAGEPSPDKGFVFLGSQFPTTGPQTSILKIDSLDNFQWSKVYQRGFTLNSATPPAYSRINDGSIIYSVYDYDTLQNPEKGLMLMKTDPYGNGCITQNLTSVTSNMISY